MQKLALMVPLDPKRTFTPKVTKLVREPGDGVERRVRAHVQRRAHLHADRQAPKRMHRVRDGRGVLRAHAPDDQGQPARLRARVFEAYADDLKRAPKGGSR